MCRRKSNDDKSVATTHTRKFNYDKALGQKSEVTTIRTQSRDCGRFIQGTTYVDIHQSLERVYESKDLLGTRFYENYLVNCPEARPYFDGVDMHRQAIVITMALTLVEQYYRSPFRATEDYLLFLGTRHEGREIPLEFYPKWLDSMMDTLEEFHDSDWDESLAEAWSRALKRAIDKLMEGYAEPVFS